MAQEKYDLVFAGKVLPGFELAVVKKSIQQLFRVDDAKLEVLFSGREIPLKKGLDADTVEKYRTAIEKAGASVTVTANVDLVSSAIAAANLDKSGFASAAESPRNEVTPAPNTTPSFTTELGAQPVSKPAPVPAIVAPAFEVAAVGEAMLPPGYQRAQAPVSVDLSAYSVAPAGGNLVRPEELPKVEALNINVPNVGIAPVGSDLISAAERPAVPDVVVDISDLSLAQVGERLAPPSKPAPAAPNVDHIKLVN